MSGDNIILVDQLGKRYGRKIALAGITFGVPRHATLAIVGPNGAGKTTLISIIAGLVKPSQGKVIVRDDGLNTSKALIGLATDRLGAYPDLSGRQNLNLEAMVRGLNKEQCERTVDRLGMTAYADRAVRTYSMGMRQRLQIAHAILSDPEIIVLDEPTNGLDPDGLAELKLLILELKRQQKTILLCTHILAEADELCSHALMLREGKVIYSGPVEQDYESTVVEVRVPDCERLPTILADLGYTDIAFDDVSKMTSCQIGRTAISELTRKLAMRELYPDHIREREVRLQTLYSGINDRVAN